MTDRVLEAYVGEYASGKSELAINRALELKGHGLPVTLVDLDLVEPFYTLRPLKAFLEEQGLGVVGWGANENFGLGETGGLIKPAARWVLRRPGHIIMDVGYGVRGAHTLNLIEGALESSDLTIMAVVNTSRPITASVADIVEYVRSLGRIDGLINNTHLGSETTIERIMEGYKTVSEAAGILSLPVCFTAVVEALRDKAEAAGLSGDQIRYIRRYMPGAMW
ncbi:MAG: hypothetical protein ACM3QZ_12735 [Solirubrobacterales bacterium]